MKIISVALIIQKYFRFFNWENGHGDHFSNTQNGNVCYDQLKNLKYFWIMRATGIVLQIIFCWITLSFFLSPAFAQEKIVNVYCWTGYVPESVIRQFQKETGIKVNLSTYENNEVMYAKLRTTKNAGYDIVMPSSYFVDRMRRQNMLEALDKTKLTQWKNINSAFLDPVYDPRNQYSAPFIWGVTGIFLNNQYYSTKSITKWSDLWNKNYRDQLMLLDDTREVFSMGLLSMGYSANDKNPEHIRAVFLKLKALMPNVKVFSSDTVISNILDEDANLGMAWNGDTFKASQDNPHATFIFPKDGFVIWVDTITIPKNAPHKEAAYVFLNFLLRADVGKEVALYAGYPIANFAAQQLLPPHLRNNATIYPSKEVLKHGQFQTDLGEDTLALYEKYWEELKMSG